MKRYCDQCGEELVEVKIASYSPYTGKPMSMEMVCPHKSKWWPDSHTRLNFPIPHTDKEYYDSEGTS
jgi:hypothetical protein